MVQCDSVIGYKVHWSWTFLVEIQFQLLYQSIIHLYEKMIQSMEGHKKHATLIFLFNINFSHTVVGRLRAWLEVTKNGNEDKRVKIFSRWNILQIKFGPFFKNKLQRSLRKRQTMPFNPVLDCHRIKSSFLTQPIISNMS